MHFVEHRKVKEIAPNSYMTEASDIGLAPNEWPDFIALGDESPFFIFGSRSNVYSNNEFIGCQYQHITGNATLLVAND